LFNPIGLIVTGIALGAGLIIKLWKPISGFFKAMWGKVSGPATAAFGVLKTLFKWSPLGLLARGIGAGARFISGIFNAPGRAVKAAWTGFKDVMSWSPLGLLGRAWDGVGGLAGRAWGGVKSVAGRAWGGLKSIFGWRPHGTISKAWGGVKDMFAAIFDGIKGLAKTAFGKVGEFLKKPLDGIKSLWGKIKGFGVATVTVLSGTAAAAAPLDGPRDFPPPPPPASAPAILASPEVIISGPSMLAAPEVVVPAPSVLSGPEVIVQSPPVFPDRDAPVIGQPAARQPIALPDIRPADTTVIRPEVIPAPAAIAAREGDIHLHLTLENVFGDARSLAQQLRPELMRMLREAKDANLHD